MKTIAFFVRNIDANLPPFDSREYYFYSYQEMFLALKRAGAQTYYVTGNTSYLGKGTFSQSWTIDTVSEVADFTPTGQITADIVIDRANFTGTDIPVVTDQRLHEILNNKAATYAAFGQYQPRTTVCGNEPELRAAMQAMPGDYVVIKNPNGNSGDQVYIGGKQSLTIPARETYPLLVQEFVDMSDGIPGLVEGPHDLRVLMAGNTIIGATLRKPAPGSLYANISQGGSQTLLDITDIPEEVRAIVTAIDEQLEDFPRYYSLDFARGKQGWVLIELNNKPGLFPERTGPLARVFMDRIANYLAG